VEIEQHLESCNSCHESADDVEDFAKIFRGLEPEAPKVSLCETLCDCFETVEVDDKRVWVAFSKNGIKRIDLRPADEASFRRSYLERFGRELRPGKLSDAQRQAIVRALGGEETSLPELDTAALTPFEQEVLRVIARIPRGEVRSYEWVAQRVGRPRAVRAIGNVMANNPLPFVLPCHRVVPSQGGIGNYGFGTEMKRELLASEGTPVEELEQLAREGVRFIGSRTTKIFCFPTCKDARRIREDNRVPFHSVGEAEEKGFRGCRRCLPAAMSA
jgi:O-6-methylguanine DNA methyltransferase